MMSHCKALLLLLVTACSSACMHTVLHAPAHPQDSAAERGAAALLQGDFGMLTADNLSNNAAPFKLLEVLPTLVPEAFNGQDGVAWQAAPDEPLRRFGYIYHAHVAGLPDSLQPTTDAVGQVRGTLHAALPSMTLELVANTCATCHAGRTWDANGMPTQTVVLGIPNHSIDFDGLVQAITTALQDPRARDAALLQAMQERFDMSQNERDTYKYIILPRFRASVRQALQRYGALHAWRFGGPGMSHGAAILRDLEGAPWNAAYPAASTKIPTLYGTSHKQRILIDGSYLPRKSAETPFVAAMVGFLPVLGVTPERAVEAVPALRDVDAFLQTVQPPRFPGAVDAERAQRGATVYAAHCAACHGSGGRACAPTSDPIPQDVVETDPTRLHAVPQATVRQFNRSAVGAYMQVRDSNGYVPPPLCAIWANAPYLHNGSVPTLWHLLHPTERPARFYVGGHRLDMQRVGIAGSLDAQGVWQDRSDYVPWSQPVLYDTQLPGHSNRGHSAQVQDLTEAHRSDLLEYLKTL